MPELRLADSLMTSLNAQEPWPDNVKLFQPYEVEQILLPDNASCLAVQAFLKMCNLPFEVEMRWNAEFMSPSGRVPFIKCGAFVVSELEPIVQFAANKGVSLCGKLSTEEKAEMRAYMSLITNVLVNAELYISWLDNETYNAVTKIRNSSVYPWPLGWLQTRAKRNTVAKRLKALHWHEKTLDQVFADVEQCCNSLSQRLGDKDYFFGNTPTPLDALIYGHTRALLSATGPKSPAMIKLITSALLRHLLRIANITQMKLTPQEEYLITQAFQVSSRRRVSPERTPSEKSTRIKKSRLSVRNTSKDNFGYNGRDVFGFKPFASKRMIVMSSDEGLLTCEHNQLNRIDSFNEPIKESYVFIHKIVDNIFDKVEEIIYDVFTDKYIENEKDFEVIAYPENFTNVDVKMNEFLDTIEENDVIDCTVSLGTNPEDQVLNEDDLDSDGLVSDKHLAEHASDMRFDVNSQATDSSNHTKDGPNRCSVDEILKYNAYEMSKLSPNSTGSTSPLKMPSKEKLSVESLLNYLRKRNPTDNYTDYVDLD